MNVHEFIQDRNLKIKEAWQAVRTDKSKNRDQRLEHVAKQFQVSTSTVHDAVYRNKNNKA